MLIESNEREVAPARVVGPCGGSIPKGGRASTEGKEEGRLVAAPGSGNCAPSQTPDPDARARAPQPTWHAVKGTSACVSVFPRGLVPAQMPLRRISKCPLCLLSKPQGLGLKGAFANATRMP